MLGVMLVGLWIFHSRFGLTSLALTMVIRVLDVGFEGLVLLHCW